jgi:BlaI family transcriptional regulator, penicillinase repressor
MARPKVTRLELQILETFWKHGKASIREVQEAFEEPRPAYTTIQTTVYRLEEQGKVRRIRKISNAHIFEATVAADATRGHFLDDVLAFFDGRPMQMIAQLVDAGKLTRRDIREIEKLIEQRRQK